MTRSPFGTVRTWPFDQSARVVFGFSGACGWNRVMVWPAPVCWPDTGLPVGAFSSNLTGVMRNHRSPSGRMDREVEVEIIKRHNGAGLPALGVATENELLDLHCNSTTCLSSLLSLFFSLFFFLSFPLHSSPFPLYHLFILHSSPFPHFILHHYGSSHLPVRCWAQPRYQPT